MTIFDQEYAMERYTEDVRQEGWEKGQKDGWQKGEMNKARETAITLADMGLSAEQIASAVKVSLTEVKKWLVNEEVLAK